MRESIRPRENEEPQFDWGGALLAALWVVMTIVAIAYLAEMRVL